MDNIQEIAVSKLADIMSNGELVLSKRDGWKIIFNNAGLEDCYNGINQQLKETVRQIDWQNSYENNDRTYSALHKTLLSLLDNNHESFLRLINSYLEKVYKYNIFKVSVIADTKYNDLERYFLRKGKAFTNEFLVNNASKNFIKFKNSLNILCYDIEFNDNFDLIVYPLSILNENKFEQKNQMLEWIECQYPNISLLFLKAVKMFGEGNTIECLTNCRSVLTGIFSFDKTEGTKWYTGLQKACFSDKNIGNIVSPTKIIGFKASNTHSTNNDERYNYPRFKTINQIYSFLSDLGPHISEGPKLNDYVDCEICTVQDAFLGLQMTESILIWIYQNKIEQ